MAEPMHSLDEASRPGQGPESAESDSALVDHTQTEFPSERSGSARHGRRRDHEAGERVVESEVADELSERSRVLAGDDSERYVFVKEHARGGLGRVVKAEDQRLSRTVAIKELFRTSDLAEALFVREALITARLQHPGIVPVHDAGRWPTGEPYYVMKMVAGKSLKQIIRERATLEQRLALLPNVIAVAETIAYAHSEGVIHRDIKPANVMVGDFGETVVVDWGLASDRGRPGGHGQGHGQGSSRHAALVASPGDARGDALESMVDAALGATLMAEDGADSDKYSVAGKIIGTPAYMSPEQARGDHVDERSDIYALGALLYEVLAGQRPYAGKDAHGILDSVLAGPPPALDTRVSGVPPDLSTIVHKAMARDPRDRYAGARQLCDDLKRFQTGQLVAAHRYSTATLVRRWLWRHRSAVAVACAGVAIMTVMAVLGVRQIVEQRNRARAGRAQAVVAQRAAEDRKNELLLLQAESALRYDPTRTLAWLKQVPMDQASFGRARALADEAVAAGVARHVLGHEGGMFDVKFMPDASRVVSIGRRGVVRLWDVNSGAMRELGTVPDPLLAKVAVSPDGALVAASGNRGSVQAWSVDGSKTYALPDLPVGALQVFFSQDSSTLILVTSEMARLVHLESGRVRDVNRGGIVLDPTDMGGPVAASEDGRLVAIGQRDELVVVDVDTLAEVARIAMAGNVANIAFHPDGRRVLVHTEESAMVLVELGSGRTHELGRQESLVREITFSPDGGRAVTTGAGDMFAYVWDLGGRQMRVLEGNEDLVYHGVFSRDGQLVATAGDDGTARVWNLRTGEVRVLRGHGDDVYRVDMSADGTLVATAGIDGTVRLWRLPASRVVRDPGLPVIKMPNVQFTPSGHLLVYGRRTGMWLWDLATETHRRIGDGLEPLTQWPQSWNGMVTSADGVYLAAVTGAGAVLWHVPTGARTALAEQEPGVRTLWLSFGRGVLAVVDSRGRVVLWNLATGESELFLHEDEIRRVSMSPDGSLMAVELASVVQVWSVGGRRVVAEMEISPIPFQSWKAPRWIEISPDNQWMALQAHDLEFELWHLDTGRVRALDTRNIHVMALVFSPDSSEVAAATVDRVLRVWRTAGGEPEMFTSHHDLIYELAYSPDGSLLATASHDQTVRLWDRRTGRARVLLGHQSGVASLAFSPDGNLLATASLDGLVRLWSMGCDPIMDGDDLRAFLDSHTSAVIGAGDRLSTPLSTPLPGRWQSLWRAEPGRRM